MTSTGEGIVRGETSRLVALVLAGGTAVTLALWSGARHLGPVPRELDPTYLAFAEARGGVDATAAEALGRSLELERVGDLVGAAKAAESAVRAGGGRDAALQAGKIAILRGQYDAAERWLEPLANGGDPAALYNLALVAHYRGDHEGARAGYVRVLAMDAGHADALYNLAYVEWQAGRHQAAQTQAQAFRQRFPNDPRGTELTKLVEGSR